MSNMEKSLCEPSLRIADHVETPEGTPSPPTLASTVARPPPKPRRLPNINLISDDVSLDNGVKNLSLVRTLDYFLIASIQS